MLNIMTIACKRSHILIPYSAIDNCNYSCRWDNVTIHESLTGAAAAGPYCGNNGTTLPPSYTSSGNWAAIKFISDSLVTRFGFEISYSCTTSTTTTTISTTTKYTSGTTTTSTTTKYTSGTTTPTTTTGTSGYCGKNYCLSFLENHICITIISFIS